MATVLRSYRIAVETDALLKAEAARLSEADGKKVSEADVISLAVARWCDVRVASKSILESIKPKKRTRREQEVEARANSDLTAQKAERDDIDYSDIETVPTTHVASLDVVGPKAHESQGKVSFQSWRSGRKPLLKPSERSK